MNAIAPITPGQKVDLAYARSIAAQVQTLPDATGSQGYDLWLYNSSREAQRILAARGHEEAAQRCAEYVRAYEAARPAAHRLSPTVMQAVTPDAALIAPLLVALHAARNHAAEILPRVQSGHLRANLEWLLDVEEDEHGPGYPGQLSDAIHAIEEAI